jgi:hypothetical protein
LFETDELITIIKNLAARLYLGNRFSSTYQLNIFVGGVRYRAFLVVIATAAQICVGSPHIKIRLRKMHEINVVFSNLTHTLSQNKKPIENGTHG